MGHITFGVPIEIGGCEIIVIRDRIGPESRRNSGENEVFTVIEQPSTDGRPAIYVDEQELRQCREDYPGINVYGLWQILFFNDCVPLGSEVVTYPMGKGSGAYIRFDRDGDLNSWSSILSSAEYANDFSPELIDFDLSAATRVEVDIGELKVPSSPAYTRLELHERNKLQEKRRWYVVGGISVCLLVATAILNYSLQAIYRMQMSEYRSKQNLISSIEIKVAELKRERLAARPDDSKVIDRLIKIFEYEPHATTEASVTRPSGFTTEHRLVSSMHYPADLSKKIEGVTAELDSALRYQMVVSPE